MMTNENFTAESAPCPHCGARHAPPAPCVRAETSTVGPLMAQAESLFESYLAARLVRARRNLTSTKVALLRDPRSREKRDQLLRAEAETEKLQAQLLDQVRRATLAREQVRNAARPDVPSEQPTETFRNLQAAKAELSAHANVIDAATGSSSDAEARTESLLKNVEQTAKRFSKFTE